MPGEVEILHKAIQTEPAMNEDCMAFSKSILFPVDFSPAGVAMAPYVKRAAALYGSRVSLIHVVDPANFGGFELYSRPPSEIAEEHRTVGRERLDSFLTAEFPVADCPRILASGDAATEIARVAKEGQFDLIIMPTHTGIFRQMLLGSTTAKVLNDADCPVLTSMHAETIAPRPLDHREWLCAVGLTSNSEKVLRFAKEASEQVRSKLHIIHAVQIGDPGRLIRMDLQEQVRSAAKQRASQRIAELLEMVGLEAPVRIVAGSVKDALLEAARQSDADALIIGRGSRPGAHGRMRDLTYAVVRDSPFPVVSV